MSLLDSHVLLSVKLCFHLPFFIRVNACLKYGWKKSVSDEPELPGEAVKPASYPENGWIPLILPFHKSHLQSLP